MRRSGSRSPDMEQRVPSHCANLGRGGRNGISQASTNAERSRSAGGAESKPRCSAKKGGRYLM